ncbi:hypothetical protein C1E24_00450 [Pseudoalteromonas phenolica]|uniref:Uncharacterized protein n=1 Tax=Pseudoalteromonas phenolica TaxID=161398 RepID=A0A5R9Q8C9_9GAMM|nr:hypothetical protein [Pseudoalteromonas phenolica]TLX49012.1 hypothetical protein C1E24_00450 [Pseudoalteromonas phenolica]
MKLQIFAGLSLLVSSFMAIGQDNDTKLIMCKDCSYSESKKLAKKYAPSFQCYNNNPNGPMTPDTQACYSSPRKVIIADANGNNHHAFTVRHYNQGTAWLELAIESARLNTTDYEAIRRVNVTADNLEKLASELENELKGVPLTSKDFVIFSSHPQYFSSYSQNTGSCPAYISDAFDAVYDGKTATRLSEAVNKKINRESKDPGKAFMVKRMNSEGFSVEVTGVSYSGSWKDVVRVFNTEIDLQQRDSDVPVSDLPGYKVVYGLTWNDRWGAIEVDINPILTVLGGVSLSNYGKAGKIHNLDPCVEKEFDKYLRNEVTNSNNTSPGGGIAPGGGPGAGGGNPWPGGGGGDGWDNQQCEKHYYWKDGTLAFTVLVPC